MVDTLTQSQLDYLRRPHVARAFFAVLDLPSGVWRVHSGSGNVTLAGQEWFGVSDPGGRQLTQVGVISDQRFGVAAKLDIVISGVNLEFLQSVKAQAREIEGSAADVYWCAVDQETLELWPGGLKPMFPLGGFLSAPKIIRSGIGERHVSLAIEGRMQSMNYQWGGMWTDADQRRRYPGDKGLMFVGVDVIETIKP